MNQTVVEKVICDAFEGLQLRESEETQWQLLWEEDSYLVLLEKSIFENRDSSRGGIEPWLIGRNRKKSSEVEMW